MAQALRTNEPDTPATEEDETSGASVSEYQSLRKIGRLLLRKKFAQSNKSTIF
jgi:hypothetical protein